MIFRADPSADLVVEYGVDANAAPGNTLPSLARLLIDLAQRQNETSGPAMAARLEDLVPPDLPVHEDTTCLL
ncbi:MAG: hypothetical protein WCB27_06895 [Thermoguttaceae bacterium]